VLFPPPDPAVADPPRHHAGGFRRHPAPRPSPPGSFRVPPALDGGLELTMRSPLPGAGRGFAHQSVAAQPLKIKTFQASFTADWQSGRPKLQRGVYLLGVRPGTWDRETVLPAAGQHAQAADLCSVVVSVEPIAPE